ncbi:MAG: hypothetical protein AMXMBFR84_07720 [Candidatus Hydrogenedentota bacterium]
MAEGDKDTKAKEAGKGSPLIKWLVLILAPILIAAICGLVLWAFVLKPMLNAEEPPPPPDDMIPIDSRTVDLPESNTTIIMPSTEYQASILQYQVALVCADARTEQMVNDNKSRFVDLARRLHSYKTREELQHPMVEESIRRQILQEANQLLLRLPDPAGGEGGPPKIIEVLHLKFFPVDP